VSTTAAAAPSRPFARPAGPSFLGAVRGEVLKLSRQKALWALLAGGTFLLLLVSLTVFGNDSLKQRYQQSPGGFFIDTVEILGTLFDAGSGIVLLVSASRLFGMEYSGGTLRILLSRGLGRLQLYFAKLAALLLLAVVLFAGYALLATVLIELAVQHWTGSWWTSPLDEGARQFLVAILETAAVSLAVTILLGAAVAILGRSLAFGIGVAMAFFPADNFITVILAILNHATKIDFFNNLSAYLLGPNLNTLPLLLHPVAGMRPAFATPLVTITAAHAEWVIAAYAAVFFGGALILLTRRDVLE
jgi:ABC-type transport system involved in multi-copper enzyme maturation permease subunit